MLSPNVRFIANPEFETSMAYHTLYGNPRIVNDEARQFLDLFKYPVTQEEIAKACDENPEEIIKEFEEILFLVEPGFDEKMFLRSQKAQHLSQIKQGQTVDRMGLAISDLCNFGCSHCLHRQSFNSGGIVLQSNSNNELSRNMSWETAKQCIDQYILLMRKNECSDGKIHFGNAEPLINWPVIKNVLVYCSQMSGLKFEFAINTNLSLMTREIAETLKEYRVVIATSLDGTAQANDVIRVTKGGKGTFALLLKKFDLLAEIGYPLDGFSITVTKRNFDFVDVDIIDLAAARGMVSLAFDYDLISLIDVPIPTRVEKLMVLKRYANDLGIDFFGTWDSAFRNLTSVSLLTGSHAFCAAVQGKSVEFNVDGSIKVCGHTCTSIGHVDRFDEMFNRSGGLFKIVQERFPGADAYCKGCVIEGPCGGQCHVTREVDAQLVGDQRQSLFADMCDFYRSVTDALALEYLRSNGASTVVKRHTCGV
jgi:uncharacterized protein